MKQEEVDASSKGNLHLQRHDASDMIQILFSVLTNIFQDLDKYFQDLDKYILYLNKLLKYKLKNDASSKGNLQRHDAGDMKQITDQYISWTNMFQDFDKYILYVNQ